MTEPDTPTGLEVRETTMNGIAPQTMAPPPPGPAAAPGARTPARLRWVATATAIVLGGAVGGLWAGLSPAADEPVSDVRLEATSYAGPNPFMAPVGQDRAGVVSPAGTEGTHPGDTPGLYGEQTDKPSCTGRALVDNLAADAAKAGAWSQALGIQPAEVESYVGTLNPVVLRSDTAVTEHGYTDGRYTPYPAVLQAGTSVFVNSHGEPTVKCFSGNPLTRPGDFRQAGYTGDRWQTFAPTRITYVKPAPVVVKTYVYVDIDRGTKREHRSWCSDHPDSKYCERPNPDRWCERHPDSKHCDGREDSHHDSDQHKDRDGKDDPDHKDGDGKDPDHKDGDGKDPDHKDGDGKGSEHKGGDGKGSEHKGGDGKGSDHKGGDGKGSDRKAPDAKDGKGPVGEGSDGKGSDGKDGKVESGTPTDPAPGTNPPDAGATGSATTAPGTTPVTTPCTGPSCSTEPKGRSGAGAAEGGPDAGSQGGGQGGSAKKGTKDGGDRGGDNGGGDDDKNEK